MAFKIVDLWEAPKHKLSKDPNGPALRFPFVTMLLELKDLPIKEPKVWLWIPASTLDDVMTAAFISTYYLEYNYKVLMNKPLKTKQLNDVINQKTAQLLLHFMFKRYVLNFILGLSRKSIAPARSYTTLISRRTTKESGD